MTLIRCHTTITVGETRRVWGCGRVWDGKCWRWPDPMEVAQDNGICGDQHGGAGCGARLREAQKRARVRIERRTELRAEQGFGPGTGDAFKGF